MNCNPNPENRRHPLSVGKLAQWQEIAMQTRPDQLAGRLLQTLIFVRPDYEASRVIV